MFNYAKKRMATFWRTKSSLLLVARRHLRNDIRDDRDIREVLLPNLKQAIDEGDVSRVEKKWNESIKKWERVLTELPDDESKAFLAEGRMLQDLHQAYRLLEKVIDRVRHLYQEAQDHAKDRIAHMLKELEQAHADMKAAMLEEKSDLEQEYIVLLRQEKEEKGIVQNFVFAYAEIMQVMDELWNERSETRKVERELEDVDKEAEHILVLIERLAKSPDKGMLIPIEKEAKRIEQETHEFRKMFHVSMQGFLLIIKIMVDLWFQFRKDGLSFEEIEAQLKESGFPEEDLKEFITTMQQAEEKNHDAAQAAVNAFRRMARLQTNS